MWMFLLKSIKLELANKILVSAKMIGSEILFIILGKSLRWMFRKLEGVMGTGRSWLRIGTGGGHL
jgi:hypothetical protein